MFLHMFVLKPVGTISELSSYECIRISYAGMACVDYKMAGSGVL